MAVLPIIPEMVTNLSSEIQIELVLYLTRRVDKLDDLLNCVRVRRLVVDADILAEMDQIEFDSSMGF
jgi:hypothetical protein